MFIILNYQLKILLTYLLSEGEYIAEDEYAQTTSANDCCILYEDSNEDNMQGSKLISEELLDISGIITEYDEVIPTKQESISINANDYIGTSDIDVMTSTSCISPAASSTTDFIHSSERKSVYTTNESIMDAAGAKADLVLNNDKEIYNYLNETTVSDKSYESDKHFALSLVYYFQRLNAKKKAQAKIDILTYLVALQDKDS